MIIPVDSFSTQQLAKKRSRAGARSVHRTRAPAGEKSDLGEQRLDELRDLELLGLGWGDGHDGHLAVTDAAPVDDHGPALGARVVLEPAEVDRGEGTHAGVHVLPAPGVDAEARGHGRRVVRRVLARVALDRREPTGTQNRDIEGELALHAFGGHPLRDRVGGVPGVVDGGETIAVVDRALEELPGDDATLQPVAVHRVTDVDELGGIHPTLDLEGQAFGQSGNGGLERELIPALSHAHAADADRDLDIHREPEADHLRELTLVLVAPGLRHRAAEATRTPDELVLVVHLTNGVEVPIVRADAVCARAEEKDIQLVFRKVPNHVEARVPDHFVRDLDPHSPGVALDPVPRGLEGRIEDDDVSGLRHPERPARVMSQAGDALELPLAEVFGGVVEEDLRLP